MLSLCDTPFLLLISTKTVSITLSMAATSSDLLLRSFKNQIHPWTTFSSFVLYVLENVLSNVFLSTFSCFGWDKKNVKRPQNHRDTNPQYKVPSNNLTERSSFW